MIQLNVKLRTSGINKIRALFDGESYALSPISRIDIRIPTLNIIIIDSTPDEYPIKWEQDPVDLGLIELRLGDHTDIVNAFTISVTGDTTISNQWIEDIDPTAISNISKGMCLEGLVDPELTTINSINRQDNKIKVANAPTATADDVVLTIYEDIESSIHEAQFYIYNVQYPSGLYWANLQLNLGF